MGWKSSDIPDQHGRVAVITGANSGLGLAAARELAGRGATVVLAVRDVAKGRAAMASINSEVPGARLELYPVDLASLDSVRACAAAIRSEHERIDVLINNAGVVATPASRTADGFEYQVGTNHLGHVVFTAELLPAHGLADAARVVTVTSGALVLGRMLDHDRLVNGATYHPWRAYGDSKLANFRFGAELARRLEASGSSTRSLVAHPGLADTDLMPTTVRNGGAGRSGRLSAFLAARLGMPPPDGALSLLRAAADPAASNGQLYGPRWIMAGPPVQQRWFGRWARPESMARSWEVTERALEPLLPEGLRWPM